MVSVSLVPLAVYWYYVVVRLGIPLGFSSLCGFLCIIEKVALFFLFLSQSLFGQILGFLFDVRCYYTCLHDVLLVDLNSLCLILTVVLFVFVCELQPLTTLWGLIISCVFK